MMEDKFYKFRLDGLAVETRMTVGGSTSRFGMHVIFTTIAGLIVTSALMFAKSNFSEICTRFVILQSLMPRVLVPKNANTRVDFFTLGRINTWPQLLEADLAYF